MQLAQIHEEILKLLEKAEASYANPLSSQQISGMLNVTPSYVREQSKLLQEKGYIQVRRGPGGGYFLNRRGGDKG